MISQIFDTRSLNNTAANQKTVKRHNFFERKDFQPNKVYKKIIRMSNSVSLELFIYLFIFILIFKTYFLTFCIIKLN